MKCQRVCLLFSTEQNKGLIIDEPSGSKTDVMIGCSLTGEMLLLISALKLFYFSASPEIKYPEIKYYFISSKNHLQIYRQFNTLIKTVCKGARNAWLS